MRNEVRGIQGGLGLESFRLLDVSVCLFVSMLRCLCVLNGSGGYRWHPIKESAGHLAIECSFKDPIVVMGRGSDHAYACVGCVSNRTCAYSA